ncbi:hypothetical protein KCP73_18975 [Salmonella enterica subsp. enterica]|nr:hypothetical protein KCP73_18975 [Salmonella enterica subsp. enterica]
MTSERLPPLASSGAIAWRHPSAGAYHCANHHRTKAPSGATVCRGRFSLHWWRQRYRHNRFIQRKRQRPLPRTTAPS